MKVGVIGAASVGWTLAEKLAAKGHDVLLANSSGPDSLAERTANAGVPQTPEELLRATFEANFFAPILLIQALLPLVRRAPAGRIVNLSSIRGSLTHQADPTSPVYPNKALAYDTSKTALNTFTLQLAEELRGTSIKVNAIYPGWVRTSMGSDVADLSVEDGARTAVLYASLPSDRPTGGFFYLNKRLPW